MRHESLYLTDILEAADHIAEFKFVVGAIDRLAQSMKDHLTPAFAA